MPDNIARNYLELLQVSRAADEMDSIAALRAGLTAQEGKVVADRLEARRAELIKLIKEQVDVYSPTDGVDLVIEPAAFDWKRARKPTGYIQPVGLKDITRAVGLVPIDTTDNRMLNVWSFSAKWPGQEIEETRCAIWDFESSDDEGKWYCYGDVDIMRRLFGRRYVYTAN